MRIRFSVHITTIVSVPISLSTKTLLSTVLCRRLDLSSLSLFLADSITNTRGSPKW